MLIIEKTGKYEIKKKKKNIPNFVCSEGWTI